MLMIVVVLLFISGSQTARNASTPTSCPAPTTTEGVKSSSWPTTTDAPRDRIWRPRSTRSGRPTIPIPSSLSTPTSGYRKSLIIHALDSIFLFHLPGTSSPAWCLLHHHLPSGNLPEPLLRPMSSPAEAAVRCPSTQNHPPPTDSPTWNYADEICLTDLNRMTQASWLWQLRRGYFCKSVTLSSLSFRIRKISSRYLEQVDYGDSLSAL